MVQEPIQKEETQEGNLLELKTSLRTDHQVPEDTQAHLGFMDHLQDMEVTSTPRILDTLELTEEDHLQDMEVTSTPRILDTLELTEEDHLQDMEVTSTPRILDTLQDFH